MAACPRTWKHAARSRRGIARHGTTNLAWVRIDGARHDAADIRSRSRPC